MAANLIFFNKLPPLITVEVVLYYLRLGLIVACWCSVVLEGMYLDREHVSSGAMEAAIRAPPMLFSWFLNNGVIC